MEQELEEGLGPRQVVVLIAVHIRPLPVRLVGRHVGNKMIISLSKGLCNIVGTSLLTIECTFTNSVELAFVPFCLYIEEQTLLKIYEAVVVD